MLNRIQRMKLNEKNSQIKFTEYFSFFWENNLLKTNSINGNVLIIWKSLDWKVKFSLILIMEINLFQVIMNCTSFYKQLGSGSSP